MSYIANILREFNIYSVSFRLIIAMLAGGMIGFERESKHRPAGLRTYMLVCLGAALTMLLSQYESEMLSSRWAEISSDIGIKTDVSRFGAQVINGIGFIGAGTIIVTGKQKVTGLTTAAGLWASACMGLAIGAGFYECVFLSFILIFLCIIAFPIIDDYIRENTRFLSIYVQFFSLSDISEITDTIKSLNAEIIEIEIERGDKKRNIYPSAVFSIRLSSKNTTHADVISAVSDLDTIRSATEL